MNIAVLPVIFLSLSIAEPLQTNSEPSPGSREIRLRAAKGAALCSVALSSDGEHIYVGTVRGDIFSISKAGDVSKDVIHLDSGDRVTGGILSLCVSEDNLHLIAGCANRMGYLVNLPLGKAKTPLPGHRGSVRSVLFAHCDTEFLTGSTSEYCIRKWSRDKREPLFESKAGDRLDALAVNYDKSLIASSCFMDVDLWSLIDGKNLAKLTGAHKARVYSVAFGSDWSHLFSCDSDGVVAEWDVAGHKLVRKPPVPRQYSEYSSFSGNADFLLYGSPSDAVRLVEVQSGKTLWRSGKLNGTLLIGMSRKPATGVVVDDDDRMTIIDISSLRKCQNSWN